MVIQLITHAKNVMQPVLLVLKRMSVKSVPKNSSLLKNNVSKIAQQELMVMKLFVNPAINLVAIVIIILLVLLVPAELS